MKKFIEEFKKFALRGNVMDMAVGIIIGAAFTAIVTSFVSDIVQPFIVLVTGGGTGVSGLVIPVAGTPNGIDFGAFISAIINFLIIAFVVCYFFLPELFTLSALDKPSLLILVVLGLLAFSVMFVCRPGLRKAKARLDKGIFPHRKKR